MKINVTNSSETNASIVMLNKDGTTTIEFVSGFELRLVGQTIIGKEL